MFCGWWGNDDDDDDVDDNNDDDDDNDSKDDDNDKVDAKGDDCLWTGGINDNRSISTIRADDDDDDGGNDAGTLGDIDDNDVDDGIEGGDSNDDVGEESNVSLSWGDDTRSDDDDDNNDNDDIERYPESMDEITDDGEAGHSFICKYTQSNTFILQSFISEWIQHKNNYMMCINLVCVQSQYSSFALLQRDCTISQKMHLYRRNLDLECS